MSIEIHPKFKLNGHAYSQEELKEVAYSLVKEGEPYEKEIGDFLLDWGNEASGLEVKTSGSTGVPKPISLEKWQMFNSAKATGEYFDLKAGNSALHCLPTQYIAGKMMLVRAMVLGLELDYIAPSSNPLEHTSKSYDFCAMVPIQLENSLEKLDLIRILLVGGAAISRKLIERLENSTSEIYETYGMTETVSHIAVRKINNCSTIHSMEGVESELAMGGKSKGILKNDFKCLPNVTVSVNHRGCLVIHAPNISGEDIITNDLVNLRSETEFEWLGRFDNVINSGGIKLFPEQIEAHLAPIIANRFFVAGLPDNQLGQKMVLLVEGDIDKQELMEKIKSLSSLSGPEYPKEILTIPKMITTPNGKMLRKETLLQAIHSNS
ncbi:MAG: AMP-binding protein [Maribacter sp.]|nr:AMP-binding protein [Maribacter sp.]